jgi:cation diffusion facilitator CzcD-associated flavoprotein CzcO
MLTCTRSSGIQILPAVQQEAASVTTFIRTATWVTPLQGFDQHTYTSQEKAEFENNPQKLLDWRKETESNVNNIYSMFLNGSRLQESTKKRVTMQMEQRLHKPDLRELLVPKWDFGCRRMTPGINYLETLQADNVTVVTGQVERITPSGCVANGGQEYPVDVLICATGFDVSFRPRFSIKGKDGQDLRDVWSGEAHSYLGVGAPSQPNYFHFLGPNCPIGSGPLVGAIGTLKQDLFVPASIH